MRADATRNIQAVLRAAARVFAADPLARIADVAEAAGVDKRTVYRRFDSREDLLLAVYRARLDELESLIDATSSDDRPVRDALLAFAEGGVRLSRDWPVDIRAVADPAIGQRREELDARMDEFLRRAEQAGVIAAGLPARWSLRTLQTQLHTVAQEMPALEPGPAAALVVETFLHGVGA
ncbi:TetR/AcrR family transcriptional regulator [Lentzea californiensis]|uniref:TetR/AcrR family transcriptional regulator n=1 Tax=Lentzea californiensis TaxID=438851 RepID=UPI002166070E|nr:TetR/AcrR family transcriptional regulator [Lentzea californiensis]MCR3753134.1 transcriptional regulator, TetR family [Lentzea californiensis]